MVSTIYAIRQHNCTISSNNKYRKLYSVATTTTNTQAIHGCGCNSCCSVFLHNTGEYAKFANFQGKNIYFMQNIIFFFPGKIPFIGFIIRNKKVRQKYLQKIQKYSQKIISMTWKVFRCMCSQHQDFKVMMMSEDMEY